MPRNLRKKTPSANLDISLVNIAQLTRLPAKILSQHLSSHHLVTAGTKAMIARQLYQAIHQPPITQVPTSDSTYSLKQQLSPPPSLPATQQSFTLPTAMHTAALQQPITLQSPQLPVSLLSTQQPITSLAQPSTASLQPPPPVSMQQPVTSLTQQHSNLQRHCSHYRPSCRLFRLDLWTWLYFLISLSAMQPPHNQHLSVRRHLQPSRQLPSKTV